MITARILEFLPFSERSRVGQSIEQQQQSHHIYKPRAKQVASCSSALYSVFIFVLPTFLSSLEVGWLAGWLVPLDVMPANPLPSSPSAAAAAAVVVSFYSCLPGPNS